MTNIQMTKMQWFIAGAAIFLVFIFLLMIFLLLRGSSQDGIPEVKILSPSSPHAVAVGETVVVESVATDDKKIEQVELRVNGVQVHVDTPPEASRSFIASQSWLPPEAGNYELTVVAYDSKDQTSKTQTIALTVGETGKVTPLPSTLTPEPTLTLPPTQEPTTPPTDTPGHVGPSGCTYGAEFVTDVTIPDNTELAPGTEFVKTWRLRNSGTCDWGSGYSFVFIDGRQMGASALASVPATVAGATADISVRFIAPQDPGTYRSVWRLRAPDGKDFGDRPYVQIVVPLPATATPPLTPTATPGPKPDLDITLVAGNMELGLEEMLELRVTVRNNGLGASETPALVRAVLWAGEEIEGEIPPLPAGAQETIALSYVFDAPAELDVFISVDPDDEIAEEDETNNAEQVPVVISPPLYSTPTITVTPGLRLDLDDGISETEKLDLAWQVSEGTVYLKALNGAGVAPLSGQVSSISYALVAGLTWEKDQIALPDLVQGTLFGFRTTEGRVGYAQVEAILGEEHTSAQLAYWLWAMGPQE